MEQLTAIESSFINDHYSSPSVFRQSVHYYSEFYFILLTQTRLLPQHLVPRSASALYTIPVPCPTVPLVSRPTEWLLKDLNSPAEHMMTGQRR